MPADVDMSGGLGMAGDPPAGEVLLEEMPADEAAPITLDEPREMIPAPEVPANAPQLACRSSCALGTGQVYDECGWALDTCGQRYGRWEIGLQGGGSMFTDPDGPVGPGTGNPAQMSWGVVDYPITVGARASIQYAPAPNYRVLLRATWYGSPEDDAIQTGVLGFRMTPGGAIGATVPNTATFRTEAELYGIEAHVWREVCTSQAARWDVGLGFRALRFEETTTLDPWAAPFPGFNTPPYLRSNVQNTFLGAQLGGQAHFDLNRSFELHASAKALLGSMQRDATITDRSIFAGGAHAAARDESVFAVGGEVEVGMRWRLSRNFLLAGSYNLLLLDGVVRSHDAIDLTQSATGAVQARHEDDVLVVHSLFLGVVLNVGR